MAFLRLFFILMLLLPTAYQAPRGALLLLIVLFSFSYKKKLFIHKEVGGWWILTFAVSLLSIIYSVAIGNPGALANVTVFLVWPTLYLYFMMRCHSLDVLIALLKTLVYCGLFLGVFNFIMLFNEFIFHIGFLSSIGEVLNYNYNVGITEGFVEYNTPSQSLLPYVMYFSATLLLLNPDILGVKKKYIIFSSIFAIIDILLSNRRAMWITIGLLPALLFVMFRTLPEGKKVTSKILIISIAALLVLTVTVYYMLDVEYLINEISSISDFSGDESNYERTMQFRSLTRDFLDKPLFGCGIGYASSYVRTPEHPWEYEMVYNYLLSCVGIVGFTIYLLSVCWIYIKSYFKARVNILYKNILYPQLAGLFAFIVINATNPYLLKFDFLWILFLPIVSLNMILISSKKCKENYEKESVSIS